MEEIKELRTLFKKLDIGRQYLKKFREAGILTKAQLKELGEEELENIVGEDFDGTSEIILEWAAGENNQQESTLNETKTSSAPLANKNPKIIDRKRISYLRTLSIKIENSKLLKKRSKIIENKTEKNIISSKVILKIIQAEEDCTVSEASAIAQELLDEGFLKGINAKTFSDDISAFYRFYFDDRFDSIEEKEEETIEVDPQLINSQTQSLLKSMGKLETNQKNNLRRMLKEAETSSRIIELAEKNIVTENRRIELSQEEYSEIKYFNLIGEEGDFGDQNPSYEAVSDSRNIEEILNVQSNDVINKLEEELYSSYMKTISNCKSLKTIITENENLIDQISKEGIKIKEPNVLKRKSIEFKPLSNFFEFEEKRLALVNTLQKKKIGDLTLKIKVKNVKLKRSISDPFLVFKLKNVVKRTNVGESTDKDDIRFKLHDIILENRLSLCRNSPLQIILKSYNEKNCKSVEKGKAEIDLESFMKEKKKKGIKSYELKDDDKTIGKIYMKTLLERRDV